MHSMHAVETVCKLVHMKQILGHFYVVAQTVSRAVHMIQH